MGGQERLLVIGGDAAGMSAASQARRMRPDMEIVAFERGAHTSYAACGMPYYVGGLVERERALIARTPEGFQKLGIDARTGHEVEEIDVRARRVRGRRVSSGNAFDEPFDHLVVATGTLPIRPPLPGVDASGIFSLATLADGIRVREAVDLRRPRRAVIIGGGYIGLEMAEALLMRGLDVALVEMAPTVMGVLDPEMSELVIKALREADVALYLSEAAVGFEVRDGQVVEVVTDQRSLPADIVILAIGVRPNVSLARDAGIPLGETGAIRVNQRMQTGIEGIWAAGDCAEAFHLVSRRPVHFALGTIANKQGRICGINLAGGYATFPGVVGSAITKFREVEVARTGLHEREAQAAGFAYVVGKVEGTTRARYYPDAGRMAVKVLAEQGSGRLLGAQIVGTAGAGKRIDVFATALHAGMTAQEFMYLDLSYAPPVSPVWDPVLIAARKAAQQL